VFVSTLASGIFDFEHEPLCDAVSTHIWSHPQTLELTGLLSGAKDGAKSNAPDGVCVVTRHDKGPEPPAHFLG
jgi:hypothetical protein